MNTNNELDVKKIFLSIVKSIINKSEEPLPCLELDQKAQRKLYAISIRHDLAHLIGKKSEEYGYITDETIKKLFNKQQILSVFRYERTNFDYNEIKEILIKEKIPFVPLKGLLIRGLYPEPWMRTSCDIDVLVKEEDLNKAILALKNEKKFVQEGKKNYHDVSLFSPSDVHLELHFNIKENIDYIDKLLEKVWDYCERVEENEYEYRQSKEYFVFHAVAHMLYHFKSGGCGIRPLMDLYLMHKNYQLDNETLRKMFDECGISKFYESVKLLSEVWFGEKEHTALTLSMEDYIFSGGVYGSKENDLTIKKNSVSKRKYILNRIFAPYDVIKNRYPILKKHKWLTPIYQVRRWVETLFGKKAGRLKEEIQIYDNIDQGRKEKVAEMFSALDIKI